VQLIIIARDTNSEDSKVVEVEAADYDTAKAAAMAQVPEGWRALSIRRV